jgi:hypothetical protein
VRPLGITDKDIAERLDVATDDVKNQKRQPFKPLPDTFQSFGAPAGWPVAGRLAALALLPTGLPYL